MDTTTSFEPLESSEAEQYQQYRTLSFLAVVAIVFAVISIPTAVAASMNALLLVFPCFGVILGLFAVLKLRGRTDEFTGLGLAKSGLILSTVLFLGGACFAGYVYATEVPEGYQRVSFGDLQPDLRRPGQLYAPLADELVGKKIFIKGYVYPDDQLGDIKQFILVPDMGTCCFGGQPKLTDMVQVTLEDPHRVNYSMFRRNLGGVFGLGDARHEKVDRVIFHLDADYVK